MNLRASREEVENSHWWYVGRRAVVETLAARLPAGPRLEIGCGYRGGLAAGGDSGMRIGLDLDAARVSALCSRCNAFGVQGEAQQLPFADCSFSSIMMLDILEHVRDDWLVLSEAFRVLVPGGRAILTVPAFQSLWSSHDVADMHFRRYDRKNLLRLCRSAGFRVERAGYFNMLFFPLAAAWRLLSRRLIRLRGPKDDFIMFPKPVNSMLGAAFSLERFLVPHVPLPLGLSIYATLEKP